MKAKLMAVGAAALMAGCAAPSGSNQAEPTWRKIQIDTAFERFDCNQDGLFTFGEADRIVIWTADDLGVIEKDRSLRRSEIEPQDRNGDSMLDRAEFTNLIGQLKGRVYFGDRVDGECRPKPGSP